jgi:hypothetical protein
VSSNLRITNEGIKYICDPNLPQHGGQCKKIENLDVSFTSIDATGIFFALENLPHLSKINSPKTSEAIKHLYKTYNISKQLELKQFDIHKMHQSSLVDICYIMKNVEIINLFCHSKFAPLFNLTKVNSLKLYPTIPANHTLKLTRHFSRQLTSLFLPLQETLDVSIIGYHCINLEILSIEMYANASIICEYELNCQTHFTKLQELLLNRNVHIEAAFPVNVLKCMLSSPQLQKITFTQFNFPLTVMNELIQEAILHEQVFSNLESLKYHITRNDHNLELVKDLLCVAPKFKYLNLFVSFPLHRKDITNFILRNKLHVKVDVECFDHDLGLIHALP